MDKPCCDDLPTKIKSSQNLTERIFSFADIANPIPKEIKDIGRFKNLFGKFSFIPYAANESYTSHKLLSWLHSMKELSSTHGSCVNSIKTYAIGGKLDIIKEQSQDFDLNGDEDDEVPTTAEEKKAFYDFVSSINLGKFTSIKELEAASYDSWCADGNAFLEVTIIEINSVKIPSIVYHPTENVLYWATLPSQPKVVGVCDKWETSDDILKDVRFVPVYPNVYRNGNVTKTMIHCKEGSYEWYGRPSWLNAFLYVYREFQDANYLIKQAANNFVGQVFIEVEEAAPEHQNAFDEQDAVDSGFDNVASRVMENFSSKGEGQTVMMVSRPFGAKPALVHQFKPNTNENFYKVTGDSAETKIIRAHQWSKRFLGENATQGFSANVFLDELKVKEAGVLDTIRKKAAKPINLAINFLVEELKLENLKGFSIKSKTNFELLKKFLTAEEIGSINDTPTQELSNTVGGIQE